jgi:hypothetical protein
MIITRKRHDGAFVGNELFIVAGFLALGIVGAIIFARTLQLGWLLSTGLVVAVIAMVVLVLSFVFTSRRDQ